MVPQCAPVVEPNRHTAAPTGASVLPATGSRPPLKSSTNGCGVKVALVLTTPKSASPGKTEAATSPDGCWLEPNVGSPGLPQCPAGTKPPRSAKPTEQRAVPSARVMK